MLSKVGAIASALASTAQIYDGTTTLLKQKTMYSRILFVTALFGASHAIKLGAHQDADGAIDTTD